jgi:hypothetical protein
MSDYDDPLVSRLGDLGRTPVDPHVASSHLRALAGVPVRPAWFGRLRVTGAFAAGLLVGTTGLATAGALPAPVQQIAHTTLGAVGVDVPGTDRVGGPECGDAKNHGQFVRAADKGHRAEAAHSDCGKPKSAVDGKGAGDTAPTTGGAAADCQGPPPWAKQAITDKAAKAAAQHAWEARCGDDRESVEQEGSSSTTPTTEAGDEHESDEGHGGPGNEAHPPAPSDDHGPPAGSPGEEHSHSGKAGEAPEPSGGTDPGS